MRLPAKARRPNRASVYIGVEVGGGHAGRLRVV